MPVKNIDKQFELFHYTTTKGLEGILNSDPSKRCLWATHYGHLNDRGEFKEFFVRRLPKILTHVRIVVESRCELEPEYLNEINAKKGGVDAYIKYIQENLRNVLQQGIWDIFEPFIFSMCSTKDDYISQNGLLSQWRGYGVDGGYAIVFDKRELEKLAEQEMLQRRFTVVSIKQVDYYDHVNESLSTSSEIIGYEEYLKNWIAHFIIGAKTLAISEVMESLVYLAIRHKHVGFKEEEEIRLISIPTKVGPPGGGLRKQPEIEFYNRNGKDIPHLKMFMGKELPIVRIIVGPCHEEQQLKRVAHVKGLLTQCGMNPEIVCTSETPFNG